MLEFIAFLLLLVTLSVVPTPSPQPTYRLEAEIHPGNRSFAFLGDTFPVWCSSSTLDVTDLSMGLFDGGMRRLRPLNTTVVNATHVVGWVNVTEDLIGNTSIGCWSGTYGGVLKDAMALYVQSQLYNVSDVDGLWDYGKHYVKVTWDLGHGYVQEFVDVHVGWDPEQPGSGLRVCSKATKTWCGIELIYLGFQKLCFHLTIRLHQWLEEVYHGHQHDGQMANGSSPFVATFRFSIKPRDFVQTQPPSDLKIDSISSECVELSWINPPYYTYKPLLYSVYSKDWKKENASHQLLQMSRFVSFPVSQCGLKAYTSYNIEVRLKPLTAGRWSKQQHLFIETMEGKPSHGPYVTNTSFWSGPCISGKREIYVYWKDLSQDEARGSLTNFYVNFNSQEYVVRKRSNHIQAWLNCSDAYLVEIYSSTKVGVTNHPSTLTIPSHDAEIYIPYDLNFMVVKTNKTTSNTEYGSIKFMWNSSYLPLVGDVTIDIFYCQGETFSKYTCMDDFQIRRVPIKNESLYVSGISKKVDQFGFALSQEGTTHVKGITWTNCVYDSFQKPSQPSDVQAWTGQEKNSVFVKWKYQSCTVENKALVLRSHVTYCRKESQNSCKSLLVGGWSYMVTIRNLEEDTTYIITVRSESMAGKSPASLPVFVHVKNSAPSEKSWTVVSIIICVFIFLIIMCVVFSLRRICKRRKRLVEEQIKGSNSIVVFVADSSDSGCSST